jgi:hypothetical protein
MKTPKLGMIASPMGAVVAFAAMIAILMIVSKYKGKQVLRARAMMRQARRANIASPARRAVPSRALAGTRAWRRRWDQISGSSQYSRGMTQGRKLGLHIHMS